MTTEPAERFMNWVIGGDYKVTIQDQDTGETDTYNLPKAKTMAKGLALVGLLVLPIVLCRREKRIIDMDVEKESTTNEEPLEEAKSAASGQGEIPFDKGPE